TPQALWKVSWVLRDFGYDTELLGRDEVDERALITLRGVVKISHALEKLCLGVGHKWGKFYFVPESSELCYQSLATPLESDRCGGSTILNIVNPLVQYLPDQPTEAMSNRPNGFVVFQTGQ